MRKTLIALSLILAPAVAHADAGTDLNKLVKEYWAAVLKESPVMASSLGDDSQPGAVGDYSLAGQDRFA